MRLNNSLKQFILQTLPAQEVWIEEQVQQLWSGYGQILRLGIKQNGKDLSIVVKEIDTQSAEKHPRGWNTNLSHQRKLKSYEVETFWYQNYGSRCNDYCKIPRLLGVGQVDGKQYLLLEDLNRAGFPLRKSLLSVEEVLACLSWLAGFHGTFMQEKPTGLWETGTYWHLDTRPDEYKAMKSGLLKANALRIDQELKGAQFQTIVHGDAKLANFCFSSHGSVATVDFQYVGGGCGMKDVAYFLGSCLSSQALFDQEEKLLKHYFSELKKVLPDDQMTLEIEEEWSRLYPYAWADFSRFLEGWMPGHHKLNGYAGEMVKRVLSKGYLA